MKGVIPGFCPAFSVEDFIRPIGPINSLNTKGRRIPAPGPVIYVSGWRNMYTTDKNGKMLPLVGNKQTES